jgi:hypothetical protein
VRKNPVNRLQAKALWLKLQRGVNRDDSGVGEDGRGWVTLALLVLFTAVYIPLWLMLYDGAHFQLVRRQNTITAQAAARVGAQYTVLVDGDLVVDEAAAREHMINYLNWHNVGSFTVDVDCASGICSGTKVTISESIEFSLTSYAHRTVVSSASSQAGQGVTGLNK